MKEQQHARDEQLSLAKAREMLQEQKKVLNHPEGYFPLV